MMSCLKESIRQNVPGLQGRVEEIEKAPTLGLMIWGVWRLIRELGVKLLEEELSERAKRPTPWPKCPRCGKKLRSKGFEKRQVVSLLGIIHKGLFGPIRWESIFGSGLSIFGKISDL